MKQEAIDAIVESIRVHRSARKQVEKLIAIRKGKRQNVDVERNLKARLNRKIGILRDLEVELRAANSVVSAPSVAEIREVKGLVTQINNLAIADATRQATLDAVAAAVARAGDVSGKVKLA